MTGEKPRVHVIGTGGSIAGIGPDRMDFMLYTEIGDLLTIEQSLDRVTEVQDIAHVDCEDLISVPSTAIGATEWLALSQRINQLLPGRRRPLRRGRYPRHCDARGNSLLSAPDREVGAAGRRNRGHAASHRPQHRRRSQLGGRRTNCVHSPCRRDG